MGRVVVGWALTLLSPENLSYASTAQTVGLTAGHFLSFTVFLAFNAPEFADRYFRTVPTGVGIFTLSGYLRFWGWGYLFVTLGLALIKKEEKTNNRDGIIVVYKTMWKVMKLKRSLPHLPSPSIHQQLTPHTRHPNLHNHPPYLQDRLPGQ